MATAFEPGQLWSTSTGRTVEIVAAGKLEFEAGDHWPEYEVAAYRFLGGSVVHLLPGGPPADWRKINGG